MAASPPLKASGQRVLQGADRVAALLMTMGKPSAARLMKHFDAEEIKAVTRSVADLRSVTAPQIETLIEEFATQFVVGANLVGTASEVQKMLSGVLPPDQVEEIMSDVLGNANRSIWDRISSVSESVLTAYILKEHPQTGALILSKVKPACAAKVIGHLPPKLRDNIMRRMLTVKPVVDETMRIMERTLHDDFMANFSRNMGADTHAKMADIINKMERDHMDAVLHNLAETRPKSAEILKSLLFTFDDLIKLTPKARTSLFDKVPSEKVVLALKGTDPAFRELILSSLASRVRRMVEQELSTSDPSPHREVAEARRGITDLAMEMASRGEIDLNSGSEDEALVS